jgi:hypothetical protein
VDRLSPSFDPYLESPTFWPDFHSRFINYWCEAIADSLPDQYEATISERVYLTEIDPDARELISPDVSISKLGYRAEPMRSTLLETNISILEPTTIPLDVLEGPRETFIEIVHSRDRALVASLELLSPSNKQVPGRIEYLAKRLAILSQRVHLIELDLLRSGHRLPFAKPLPNADYYYMVSRYENRPDCQVYSWYRTDSLPSFPVPLRSPDPDILVHLGDVFRIAFDRGRFAKRIDYSVPLP